MWCLPRSAAGTGAQHQLTLISAAYRWPTPGTSCPCLPLRCLQFSVQVPKDAYSMDFVFT